MMLKDAAFAAQNRPCTCGDPRSEEHRPRVFEVVLKRSPERDTNEYAEHTVMALSGRVISEVDEEAWRD